MIEMPTKEAPKRTDKILRIEQKDFKKYFIDYGTYGINLTNTMLAGDACNCRIKDREGNTVGYVANLEKDQKTGKVIALVVEKDPDFHYS